MIPYIFADFDLLPGRINVNVAFTQRYGSDAAAFRHVRNDYRNEGGHNSTAVGPNGIALSDDRSFGTLWYRLPEDTEFASCANGQLFEIRRHGDEYAYSVILGVPKLLTGYGCVRVIDDARMTKARELSLVCGSFPSIKAAITAAEKKVSE